MIVSFCCIQILLASATVYWKVQLFSYDFFQVLGVEKIVMRVLSRIVSLILQLTSTIEFPSTFLFFLFKDSKHFYMDIWYLRFGMRKFSYLEQ